MSLPVAITGGRTSVARNTAWNLAGAVGPMAAAVIAVPILVRALGAERFGVFMIAMTLAGYLGVFDVGLGRAVTKLIADRIAIGRRAEAASLLMTASALMLAFGAATGCALAVLARCAVFSVLAIPAQLRSETLSAFYLLAAAVPILTTSAGFRGTLAGLQRFDLINLVGIPIGMLLFLGPLSVLPFSHRLPWLVGALIAVRAAAGLAQLIFCARLLPELRESGPAKSEIKPLLSFGGWVTISNLVGPLLTYADRFVIGAVISMEAVAWYATPYEVAGRLWVVPGAVANAMFPAFAEGFARKDGRHNVLLERGLTFILLAMLPCVLVMVTFAREGLTLWLGPAFAQHSYRVLQWLAVGVLLNGVAWAPYALIQAAHRPDLTAKVHVVEAVLYFVLLWLMTRRLGIQGAAVARAVAAAADGVAILVITMVLFPASWSLVRNASLAMVAASALVALASLLPTEPIIKFAFLMVVLPGAFVLGWRYLPSNPIRRNVWEMPQPVETADV